jgi:hypothetical protein
MDNKKIPAKNYSLYTILQEVGAKISNETRFFLVKGNIWFCLEPAFESSNNIMVPDTLPLPPL